MNLRFRSSRMVCRNGWKVGVATMLLGIGCAWADDDGSGHEPQTNPLTSRAVDHTAGSQIRIHEGSQAPETEAPVVQTIGCDVSSYQGNVNWSSAASAGTKFAYIKATEATGFKNINFAQQYEGSHKHGLIRGAYHFAQPNASSGTTQADFFLDNGGGWSADGKTLPPALDIEYNPFGSICFGLSAAAMVAWVRDFSDRVRARTGRYPTIYTSANWWSRCTGNNGSFGSTHPLWIPRYGSSLRTLPAGWKFQTIWQDADAGSMPGDQDRFNGAYDRLQALAANRD